MTEKVMTVAYEDFEETEIRKQNDAGFRIVDTSVYKRKTGWFGRSYDWKTVKKNKKFQYLDRTTGIWKDIPVVSDTTYL